ncbi:MAG TPA: hypothetical protein VMT35_11425 [Ignavibacteriaceae bacterium]|nr:hypothetical protein [Ignavibacteriaceae bacterium]
MLRAVFYSAVFVFLLSWTSFSQDSTFVPDLSKVANENGWKISNRKASLVKENESVSVYFNSQEGDGVAWLEGFNFGNGIIEVDIKGKDVQGSSFVGIAFHGVDEKTYDAVYFRPFNFKSEDPVRKGHSVQYISHPIYTWNKLREEHPGEYENAVEPVPDPNSFFHAKIVIEKPKISVYVNDSKNPSLEIKELSDRNNGWIGLWVGNYSDGTFSNLKIISKNK